MKVSIIGAGPVGSYAAALLAKRGFDVTVYEEHGVIGRPIQCTGLMTLTLKEILKPSPEYVTNVTHGIELIAPNGTKLLLRAKEYIVARDRYDQYLADRARDAGAALLLNHRFLGRQDGALLVKDAKDQRIRRITSDVLIGADGANSTVARLLNPARQRRYCVGIQARVRGAFDPDRYTVYFDNAISPGFFAWIVPESEATARVGLKGTGTNFTAFIRKHGFAQIEMQAGPIPVYDPQYTTEQAAAYLVGDAATQVKATTAGGIIPGMKAAECLAEALAHGESYEKRWKRRIGRDLWLHLRLRQLLDRFSNQDWNRLIMLLGQPRLRRLLERHDREKPFRLLAALLYEPRLLAFAGRFFSKSESAALHAQGEHPPHH